MLALCKIESEFSLNYKQNETNSSEKPCIFPLYERPPG